MTRKINPNAVAEQTWQVDLIYGKSALRDSLAVGNSRFADNIWDFEGHVGNNHREGIYFKIDFTKWASRPKICSAIKLSTLYLRGLNKAYSTVRFHASNYTNYLYSFIEEVYPEITSLAEITYTISSEFFDYLFAVKPRKKSSKNLSGQEVYKHALTLKRILEDGYNNKWEGWDVPLDISWLESLFQEKIYMTKPVQDFIIAALRPKVTEHDLPSREVFHKILELAEKDLDSPIHRHVLTAAGIILESQLSLRANSFLTLKKGCMVDYLGRKWLWSEDRKFTMDDIQKLKPTNVLVVKAVEALERASENFRRHSGRDELFLYEKVKGVNKGLAKVIVENWSCSFLQPWIRHHNLRDETGELMKLTSHIFRHIFATYSAEAQASATFIMQMMDHKTLRGQEKYIHLNQEHRKSLFYDYMDKQAKGESYKAYAGPRAKETVRLLAKAFHGETREIQELIRKAKKVEILPHGYCTHHPMREKKPCENDGHCLNLCPNYFTTPEFIPVHELRMAKVIENIEVAKEQGFNSDDPFLFRFEYTKNRLEEILGVLKEGEDFNAAESPNTKNQ